MIKEEMEAEDIERRVHDLNLAMNKIRSAQADRDDVVVQLKSSKLSRLELLYDDVKSVLDDIPYDNEQFEFALSKGDMPKLWVDMTSFVRVGDDSREYEFVKDTRMGRVILGKTDNRHKMGEIVTAYIAERLLDRERMIEGDWLSLSQMIDAKSDSRLKRLEENKIEKPDVSVDANKGLQVEHLAKHETISSAVSKPQHSTLSLFIWFVLGLLGGSGILFIIVWFGLMEQIVQWVR